MGGALATVSGCVVGVKGATFSLPRLTSMMMRMMTIASTRAVRKASEKE